MVDNKKNGGLHFQKKQREMSPLNEFIFLCTHRANKNILQIPCKEKDMECDPVVSGYSTKNKLACKRIAFLSKL